MSSTPSAVLALVALLERQSPRPVITTDVPIDPDRGSTWVDVAFGASKFVVEYRAAWGFGVSVRTGNEGFGEGPDEWVGSPEDAVRWIGTRAKKLFDGRSPAPVWVPRFPAPAAATG